MPTVIKVVHDKQIRLARIGDESGVPTFAHLRSFVNSVFPDLMNKDIDVMWDDKCGDMVTISSSEELLMAIENTRDSIPKFYISAIEQVSKPLLSALI